MTQFSSKICILGDFAVGKTSTVERYVNNQFSEKYLTTIGVKVDTREVALADDLTVKLVFWDVAGTDRFGEIEFAYLRGASGHILVADGTRGDSIETALDLKRQTEQRYGELPFVFLLNKSDLTHAWEVNGHQQQELEKSCPDIFVTSAKTGENVDDAIGVLCRMIATREFPEA